MKISVILPVYSETDSLRRLTEKLTALLRERLHEIIFVVSPRCTGETFSIAEELARKYPRVKNRQQRENPGLGLAVRQGLAEASGTHVLMMDSDGEMDPATAPLMVEKMVETGCDMVVASRWMKGGGVKGYSPIKYFLNRLFQVIFRILYRTKIHDLTLGFKLARRDKIGNIRWNSIFHEIAAETTLRPIKLGYYAEEVPTVWVRRKTGVSKNPFIRNFRYVKKAFEILTGG